MLKYLILLCILVFPLSANIKRSSNGARFISYFTDTRRNLKVISNIVTKVAQVVTLQNCLSHCMVNPKCKSINFNAELRGCELIGISLKDSGDYVRTEQRSGWAYYGTEKPDTYEGCKHVWRERNSYGGEKVCCPKGKSGQYCQYENYCAVLSPGICVDKENKIQTKGKKLLSSFSSSTINKEDECMELCRKHSNAQGCELNNTKCYLHSEPISWGVNQNTNLLPRAMCWRFIKCDLNKTYSCYFTRGSISPVTGSHTATANHENECFDKCFEYTNQNEVELTNVRFDESTLTCDCFTVRTTFSLGSLKVCHVTSELPRHYGEGFEKETRAVSCKRLKQRYPSLKSGLYWIYVGDEIQNGWCDMEIDGGGWILIGHTVINNDSSSKTYEAIKTNTLENKSDQETFALIQSRHGDLYSSSKFTEVRIRCRKESSHGRTLDVVIGDNILFLMGIQRTDSLADVAIFCQGTLKFLPGDTSNLATGDCTNTKRGLDGKQFIFKYPIYNSNKLSHVNIIDGVAECDDYSEGNEFSPNGEWWYYVR